MDLRDRRQSLAVGISCCLAAITIWLSIRPTGRLLLITAGCLLLLLSGFPLAWSCDLYRFRKGTLAAVLLSLLCSMIILSVTLTNWPLKIGFALSESKFNGLAAEMGKVIPSGSDIGRVGIFDVVKGETLPDGSIRFWTEQRPSGFIGFWNCSPSEGKAYGTSSFIPLTEDWQFVVED